MSPTTAAATTTANDRPAAQREHSKRSNSRNVRRLRLSNIVGISIHPPPPQCQSWVFLGLMVLRGNLNVRHWREVLTRDTRDACDAWAKPQSILVLIYATLDINGFGSVHMTHDRNHPCGVETSRHPTECQLAVESTNESDARANVH